ncbi:hypothetical protein PILCRDRAFT_2775 [Piloderma croceum F 1598]|uniref:DRBM domain-containing protein n=1 Tax=Piloderma croceum (strain F 1598) TaxID=765440 RepID=A0A0C3BPV2_PILCF|nr:hypothetical protein PILCRDRAFT_2775 [Piloderma croceum F 1598]
MSNALKRCRSQPYVKSRIADIPQLRGDIVLQVFTHKSLDFPGSSQKAFGNNARLAELGQQALELAVTDTLFHLKHPLLDVEEIARHRDGLLADDSIEHWVNSYDLRQKVRCLPEVVPLLDTAEERRFLFNSYVGAVCVQDGAQAVQNWIAQLIRPDCSEREKTVEAELEGSRASSPTPPPSKRMKSELLYVTVSQGRIQAPVVPPRFSSALPQFLNSSTAQPLPESRPSSPPPQPTHQPNPLTPARPNTQFLPMFNQAAMQRRVKVAYETSSTGPAHALTWHARCIVNDILKGQGDGVSKQLAKEAAARQAYYAMGWAPNAS